MCVSYHFKENQVNFDKYDRQVFSFKTFLLRSSNRKKWHISIQFLRLTNNKTSLSPIRMMLLIYCRDRWTYKTPVAPIYLRLDNCSSLFTLYIRIYHTLQLLLLTGVLNRGGNNNAKLCLSVTVKFEISTFIWKLS